MTASIIIEIEEIDPRWRGFWGLLVTQPFPHVFEEPLKELPT